MGYALVGYVLMFIVLELVMIFLWAIIYVPSVRDYFWNLIVKELLFIPVLSVTIFIQIQRLISRRVFLPDKTSRFWTTKSLLFTHYEYFMVYVNAMRGILAYLYSRLLIPVGFIVLFSARLDKSMMVQGLEWLDEGYCNYIGMILADHHSNNPSVVLFVQFLTVALENRVALGLVDFDGPEAAAKDALAGNIQGGGKGRKVAGNDDIAKPLLADMDNGHVENDHVHDNAHVDGSVHVDITSRSTVLVTAPSYAALAFPRDRRVAVNKWHVAVTLINNPGLRQMRKKVLVEEKRRREEEAAELEAAKRARLLLSE